MRLPQIRRQRDQCRRIVEVEILDQGDSQIGTARLTSCGLRISQRLAAPLVPPRRSRAESDARPVRREQTMFRRRAPTAAHAGSVSVSPRREAAEAQRADERAFPPDDRIGPPFRTSGERD